MFYGKQHSTVIKLEKRDLKFRFLLIVVYNSQLQNPKRKYFLRFMMSTTFRYSIKKTKNAL